MGLDITTLRRERAGGWYVSPARICLSNEGELVACDDPAAVRLLVGEGARLPVAEAERYGLVAKKRSKTDESKAEASDGEEETPKRRTGTQDKGRKGAEDK